MILHLLFLSHLTPTSTFKLIYLTEDNSKTSQLIETLLNSSPSLTYTKQLPNTIESISEIPDMLLFYSSSDFFIPRLKSFADSNEVPAVVYGKGLSSEFLFYTNPPNMCTVNSTKAILTKLKMVKIGILWEWSLENTALVQSVKEDYRGSEDFCFENFSDLEKVEKILGKFFKAKAITNFLIIGQSSCSNIETGFQSLKMEKPWNVAVYLDNCVLSLNRSGSIGIVYTPQNSSSNPYEYISFSLQQYFSLLTSSLNRFQIKDLFTTVSINCSYSVINIKNTQQTTVAQIKNGSVQFFSNILYFSNQSVRLQTAHPPIQFSSNTGTQNPPGSPPVIQNSKYQQGTYFAVNQINTQHQILPNFELVLYDQVNCGVNVFDSNYSGTCFKSITQELGVAYLPPLYSTTMLPVLSQLNSLNIYTPLIAGMGSSSVLSNSTLYPHFARMVSSMTETIQVFARYLTIMNWLDIVVFYTNEPFGATIYSLLLQQSEFFNYRILNDEQYRKVPYISQATNSSNYTENIQNALNTGCNVFLLAMSDPAPYFWLEILYDYGVRRGDITIFYFTVTGTDAINSTGGSPAKREELMYGSFVLYNAGWVGVYGETVKEMYLQQYPNAWMPGFYIDAVYTVASNVGFMLEQGKDFEDPNQFIAALKGLRFLGVTGTVAFDSNSNDRDLFYFNIYNFFERNGQWYSEAVGLISPLSSVYYQILQDSVWPNGSIPTALKAKYLNCEYIKSFVQINQNSENMQLGISITLLILFIILSISITFKMKHIPTEVIEYKTKANFMDYVTMGFIFFESLQIISIGPSSGRFDEFVSNIAKLFSLSFSNFLQLRDVQYWCVYFCFVAVGYVWIFICFLDTGVGIRLAKRWVVKIVGIKEFLVPIMSNYMLIPFISQLFSIFSCQFSVGSELTDAFFDFDCKMMCWAGEHLQIVVTAFILLLVLVPLSVYYRINWPRTNGKVNIKQSDLYLTVKNLTLLVLILIDQVVRPRSTFIHTVIYICVVSFLGLFVLTFQAYNFDRANLWCRVMVFGVIWNSVVCLVDICAAVAVYVLLGMQLGGWVMILGIGVFFNSRLPPSALVGMKGRSIVDLFRFEFGYGNYVHTKYLRDSTSLNLGGRESGGQSEQLQEEEIE